MHRLVVFTSDLSYTVRRNIVELDDRLPGLAWLVLVHAPARTPARLLKSQRLNLRRNGWRWIPYQLGDIAARLLPQSMGAPGPQAPGGEFEPEALSRRANVRVVRVDDIHAEPALAMVREFAPDLGLSLAAPILRAPLFALPRLGTINLHKGKLPEYRGMPPAFWEIWSDQQSVGCSVHQVNEKLDQGALLAESRVARERYSSPRGLQVRLDEIGVELVCDVAQALLAGAAPLPIEQRGEGRTWRKPRLAQQAEMKRRLKRLQPPGQAALKVGLKNAYSRLAFAWHRFIGWRFAAPRVTVLLYHRVCDDARDNLSVGVEQFERQLQLLRRHCELLSIEQVLAMGEVPRSRRPLVAISFDDGYRDNWLNAAPLLRRHRVPCSFYVSTGIVGSEYRFPHDVLRGNAALPVMSWGEIRALKAAGFTVGSHTVNHIDCVAEPAETVRDELQRSRADIDRELGAQDMIFAYPYGGRHQMNDERRELVRQAGYTACLAAYGGSNIGTVDRWNVMRRGIHWEFTDAAFLYQCLGR